MKAKVRSSLRSSKRSCASLTGARRLATSRPRPRSMSMSDILLGGCSPEPLGSYLKALGVLRLIGEQVDPEARGAWRSDGFALTSRLHATDLLEFFTKEYAPTPVIAPWNGGSGFFAKDNHKALDAIAGTTDARLAPYREAIEAARSVLSRMELTDKPDKDAKERCLLPTLRAELSDAALNWIDAAVVLTSDGPKYPPLLGTGGNDGRLDFTNNQMQRLVDVLLPKSAKDKQFAERALEASLFGTPQSGMKSSAVGQFNPAAAGGANAGPGFSRDALVNPWDYIFTIEGALLFASAATKRLESGTGSGMAFPFMVAAAGVGYASASASDEGNSRNELWLPLWESPATLRELRMLFSEGRAKVGTRDARTGVDFARAIGSLGVDRGINSFARYGFHVRNGLAYMATPLGRLAVHRRPKIDLLAPLDAWLVELRRKGMGDKSPASLQRAVRGLESAILDLCSGTNELPLEVLAELGEVERVLSRSREPLVAPVPALDAAWLSAADDGSVEFSLARSLASTGLRERLVRVRWSAPWRWQENDDGRTMWSDAGLVENLLAVIEREEIESSRDGEPQAPTRRPFAAELGALQAFIDDRIDDARLERLLRGLALVDFGHTVPPPEVYGRAGDMPSAAFGVLALVYSREPRPGVRLPRTAGMIPRAASGDLVSAVAMATRRLRGAGLEPRVELLHEPRARALRTAAALAFPLGSRALSRLAQRILVPTSKEQNA
ncbi:MAG: type I-U CRISPR-associated protein Csx17 [Planctomycetes bacterium]|nr:type I-U CRISPR-associated protein Csx17 [Planctomycetota bacterium]